MITRPACVRDCQIKENTKAILNYSVTLHHHSLARVSRLVEDYLWSTQDFFGKHVADSYIHKIVIPSVDDSSVDEWSQKRNQLTWVPTMLPRVYIQLLSSYNAPAYESQCWTDFLNKLNCFSTLFYYEYFFSQNQWWNVSYLKLCYHDLCGQWSLHNSAQSDKRPTIFADKSMRPTIFADKSMRPYLTNKQTV